MQKGFTLIELLVVIVIIAVITVIGISTFSSAVPKNQIEVEADRVVEMVRRAQSRTISGDQNGVWGVHLTANNITLFQGASYAARDTAFDEAFAFSNSVTASGLTDIVFEIRTGETVNTGTITLSSTDSSDIVAIVVNAAGPYAGQVGRTAGLDIPIHPHKKQSYFTGPSDEIRKDAPWIQDLHIGFGIHREGAGLGIGISDPDQPEGFDITIDWSYLPKAAERMVPRFPFLAEVGIMRAQAGLYPDTPDNSAILGGVPELEGLYLACGFNGHGVMHSPAVGRVIAEYILGIGNDSAISLLRLSRFKDGALQKERGVQPESK